MSDTAASARLRPFIDQPFGDPDEVVRAITGIRNVFLEAHDRRAIFATAYLEMTQTLRGYLKADIFHDTLWVKKYMVSFANLYRLALLNYEQGNVAAVPKAWRISFDTSINNQGYVILDLLLGVHAH